MRLTMSRDSSSSRFSNMSTQSSLAYAQLFGAAKSKDRLFGPGYHLKSERLQASFDALDDQVQMEHFLMHWLSTARAHTAGRACYMHLLIGSIHVLHLSEPTLRAFGPALSPCQLKGAECLLYQGLREHERALCMPAPTFILLERNCMVVSWMECRMDVSGFADAHSSMLIHARHACCAAHQGGQRKFHGAPAAPHSAAPRPATACSTGQPAPQRKQPASHEYLPALRHAPRYVQRQPARVRV